MAFTKINLTNGEWTLIASNKTDITFQNIGVFGVFINFSLDATPPVETFGFLYDEGQGETKKKIVDLSIAGGAYVFARPTGGRGVIVVETN